MSTQVYSAEASTNKLQLRSSIEFVISLLIVLLLSLAVWWLTKILPTLFTGNVNKVLKTIEYPVWAIVLGFIARGLLALTRVYQRLSGAFRTEFFLKTGVILLGASLNLVNLAKIGLGGLIQSVILVVTVFFTALFIARLFRLEQKLQVLIASALSICGVSASIATGGAIRARRDQLGYVASLVVVFAIPLIFLQPALAHWLNLSPAVAGAWIGGSIDTSAAVAASGAIAGPVALTYATAVKLIQSAAISVVAFLITLYWITRVEKDESRERPRVQEIFTRFPKFILGFVVASIIVTLLANAHFFGNATATANVYNDITNLRTWFFTLAFVTIGLSFRVEGFRAAGWRPVVAFALGVVANALVALLVAWIVFGLLGFGFSH